MENDKEFKKLSLKIRYLTLELEEVKERLQEYSNMFTKQLKSLERKHKIHIIPRKRKNIEKVCKKVTEDEIPVDPKQDRKQDKIFKDLYRKVAIKAHPDKTQGDEDKTRLMRQATHAKNECDLVTLLGICDDLDISTPDLENKHMVIIRRNVKKKAEEIRTLKKTDAWVWGTASDELKKKIEDNIVKVVKAKSLTK